MTRSPTPDREPPTHLAWATRARRLHRNKRLAGLVAVILGACLITAWKLDGEISDPVLWGGIGALAGGWSLLVYVMLARWRWVRSNPYLARD